MLTKEELLKKAKKPAEDAMKLHPLYKGKIQTALKCPVRHINDFAIWYTPGVAAPCRAIKENKDLVYQYTNKANTVAVVSDGTRVLGLGDIGPEAGMPVMEGKALLFKYLGGVDAVPICLDTKDPDEIISAVKWLQPSFGGINLEDIAQPKCFKILDTLREEMEIPVWHDDQQGTATVNLAGLYNALKLVNKKIEDIKIVMYGSGAANICTARLLLAAGATPGNMIMCDSKGTLHPGRVELKDTHKEKWELCLKTNSEKIAGDAGKAFKGADVVISLSAPGPDILKKEWIKSMAKDAIVFACANPIPEIWPWEAKEAGAKIVATGRSDFPNQVNNSLGFPAIFRGTLDVQARTITDEMCIAAAKELARCAEEKGINEEYILPTMDEWEVYPRVAAAVGIQAIEQGIARINLTREELYEKATTMIKEAQAMTSLLMEKGYIKMPE
ncbi:NAD-dependent malic enzyme [Koleobacter methoxysyntrophicus]|jgi:malate dehydrogenase (oxaloacetate-decarboxylating)|uniref:NAD-dependent malic enzyme n=1 Tax=Koleobacter methoxysyntrophicus TaxID=2751313 RepID=A0A8A0RNC3_9FIRM|nr:NADP-dependent malic enzyme [Koleobacter methoxysyntrophicus]QSQ09019.1 NAD-dependent malic enzyme [Koleobacter methoxysyntrophicus]